MEARRRGEYDRWGRVVDGDNACGSEGEPEER